MEHMIVSEITPVFVFFMLIIRLETLETLLWECQLFTKV